MLQVFAERAHNDLLQLVIEAGVPGLLLLVAFLALVILAARSFLMGRTRTLADHGQHGVIAVALAVPLLHSLVDYPLRTLSITVLLGLLLSLHRSSIVEGGR
jgi:O-antigen ligase